MHVHTRFFILVIFIYFYRVCRRWNEYASSPVLWKKVNVKFFWYKNDGLQNEEVTNFATKLSSSTTHIKLDFIGGSWIGGLNFEELCVKLKERSPRLHTLILQYALITDSLSSVIDLCGEFLPDLKVLVIRDSQFGNSSREREYHGIPKMEILDVSRSGNFGRISKNSLSKMSYLKRLNLSGTFKRDNRWFWYSENVSFLHQLEFLDLGDTDISSSAFRILQNHALNLTKLFLCWATLFDNDFQFSGSVFPVIKVICLKNCRYITCEGIVSFLQSCQTLQDIYVDREVAESYSRHQFVAANPSKLGIVKATDNCHHYKALLSD